MKKNDYIKKGGLIVLSASYLFSNVGTVLAEDYQLNNSVQVYREAQEAKNRAKTNKTWPKGKYYIYKKYEGIINITREENTPGGWINPADNISVSNLPGNDIVSDSYTLKNDVKVYMDSDDAKANNNPVTVYKAGEYSLYKSYNGMINITKTSGQAGGWINPADNSDTIDLENQNKFALEQDTQGYMNSFDAKDQNNSIINVSKGEYFIYKKYNGMLNITKDESLAGVWINPTKLKQDNNANIEKSTEINIKDKKEIASYKLKTETDGYMNSDDAKEKSNAIRKVKPDLYYIFMVFNGMLNLSKDSGEAGIWINPNDNFVYTQRQQIKKVEEENKQELVNLSFDKAVDKFIDNKISEKDIEELEYKTEEITKSAVDKIANSSKEEIVKLKVSEMETLKETKPETVKETEAETVKETESETVKEIEAETVKETEAETVKETEAETAKETETETIKESETEKEVETVQETEKEENTFDENSESFFSQTYELKEKANGYLSIEDALSTNNSINILSEGKYFIYQQDNSMLNITTIKGKPGLWINPQKLFVDSNIEGEIKVGQSYQLTEEVDGYNRVTDAINELNPSTKLAAGDYIVYQVSSGVVNLTKVPNKPGIWVNLK